MMVEQLAKPFGTPDQDGFYSVYPANDLALRTRRHLVEVTPLDVLEYVALSGYVIHDYPEDVKDEDIDFKYHLILGLGSSLSFSERNVFVKEVATRVQESYEYARNERFWNHGPLKAVVWNSRDIEARIKRGDISDLLPGNLTFSLAFSAIPLWERPEVVKEWKNYKLTPFEYTQQLFFQLHQHEPPQNEVYVSTVTADNAERYIL